MEDLATDNVKVYGISYDSESSLTDFVDKYDLSYDLLSDVDSEVIKKFGILNTLITPEDPEKHPQTGKVLYGVPFPGVYVTDESGVVTEKFFYRHYASRASAGSIVDSSLGEVLMPKEAPNDSLRNDQVKITAFLADESLKFEYQSVLYVRLELEEGLHVYGGRLPEGYFATTASVAETKGLRVGTLSYPPTTPKTFEALGVTLDTYEGVVDIVVPVSLTSEVMNWTIRDKPEFMDIPVTVDYQACSETVCYRPKSETLMVRAPVTALSMPGR